LRFAAALFLLACTCVSGQTPEVSTALLGNLDWRGIGPAATGGRIADIAVSKSGRFEEVYIATTTGGVFKSVNGGVSFLPIFDRSGGMQSIGAVAVSPSNPSIVWVGTGEADNRQSSSWGNGIYKSTDGGVSWQNMGLRDTRHIGRIVAHPTDPDTVYVAAVGHLWGSNSERGVFKTTDGGRTWKRVLYRDENTGAIDLALDPRHPGTVFAALYQRQRKGWGFNGGGAGSGIFRTTDGGANWKELTEGLPAGDKGRIGLTLFAGDSKVVYAVVEADAAGGRAGSEEGPGGTGGRAAPATPRGGIFRSTDGGDTWQHLSSLNPRPMYYSRIYLDPKEQNRVYLMGSNRGFYVSDDGGSSFRDVFSAVHSEDHAMWIDPDNTSRLIIGGDGGVSISFDRGISWLFRLNLPLGQFYSISTNNADPFLVCGGLQDNGSWCTPSATNISYGISFKEAFNVGSGDGMHARFLDDRTLLVSSQNGSISRVDLPTMARQTVAPVTPAERGKPGYRWYWTAPLEVSHSNRNTLYTGANVLFRSRDRGLSWDAISGDLTAAIDREQLQMMGAPVPPHALSRHDGQSNFSVLTAIAESPLNPNVLYTGTDDGAIQGTRDGGTHWTNLTRNMPNLPAMLNISGLEASRFAPGRVYLTVDGHFNDDCRAYIFVSEDFGQSWRGIAAGLPEASVHVIREHPANPDFLVAGTEFGAWATFDRGAHWVSLGPNLPPAPVYDAQFQQSTGALVLGTHGRSIWVLDNASALAGLTPEVLRSEGRIFPIAPVYYKPIYNGQFWFGAGEFFAPNPVSGAVISYYLPHAAEPLRITVSDGAGNPVRTMRGPASEGLNRACWDLRRDSAVPAAAPPPVALCSATGGARGGPLVPPGSYRVSISPAMTAPVTVETDPRSSVSDAERNARYTAVMSAYSLQQQLAAARATAQSLASQFGAMRQAAASADLDRAGTELARAQSEIARTLALAAVVQNALDAYEGRPTAAQLRQLDWAWDDALAAVAALNRAIAAPVKWQDATPVKLTR
jgi:photosystem II stability/assembly factor-like uncharacterized protein